MREKRRKRQSELALLEQFKDDAKRGLEPLVGLEGVDAVVGIPFRNGDDALCGVVQTARRGLERMGLSGRAIILCVGPKGSKATLDAALAGNGPERDIPAHGFLLGPNLKGHGWNIRGIMEAASWLGSPLIVLRPDLTPQPDGADEEGRGFSPRWIHRLLTPVRDDAQDLALAHFSRHPLAHPVESLLVFPVIAGVFGFRLRQPTPGVFAVSHKLVRSCLSSAERWSREAGIYGFDPWLVLHTLVEGFRICEVPLGVALFRHDVSQLKHVFRQVAHTLLSGIIKHKKWWTNRSDPVAAPQVAGPFLDVAPPPYDLDPAQLLRPFKLEFNHFDDTLFREIVPDELRKRMERLADSVAVGIAFSEGEWIDVVQRFLFAYGFDHGFHPDDIVDGLFPFFLARLASFIDAVRNTEGIFSASDRLTPAAAEAVVRHEAERMLERQAELFISAWPEFRKDWHDRETETAPYLPRLGAWEFVPHVGVIVPQELRKPGGGSVMAGRVYQQLIDRYRKEFTRFLSEHLGIEKVIDSSEILSRVHGFMHNLDWSLGVKVFSYDLSTVEGAQKMADEVFEVFAEGESFQLTPEAASKILNRTQPSNLIMQLGRNNVRELLDRLDPCDAIGMAAWTEGQQYLERVLDIVEKEAEPRWFHVAPMKPIVVDMTRIPSATAFQGTAALARLVGRVMVGNLPKGWGGDFPKLWFFLRLVKRIVGVELFAEVWQGLAADGVDFGARVVASIRGHWGRRVLSAHNAYENRHQRILVERLKRFAENLAECYPEKADAADLLKAAASVYHLSITLPDATFVPLSAWTWTSYSYRGGLGAPTPLSSLVERDWATRDFLTAYMERAGIGGEEEIDKKIIELIGKGRESEDLGQHLLGVSADPDRLVVSQMPSAAPPPARMLHRPVDGPILEPIPEHPWESRYVLNAGAVRLSGVVYILYRAFGEDEISRIGLAWTKDGIHIDGRLNHPIFEPGHHTESAGCEDPRVTVIGDRMYMLYTAWDRNLAQIAMASIPVEAFVERRFDAWERHGLAFPGLSNKDAVLYPEQINGRYAIYHRIDPNMWISYIDSLACPWPRKGHKIVVGPRAGMMWDGVKIGAGAQPIKTAHGWLNIYHGVDYQRCYRLGVLFMALENPAEVIYQSPNPILQPEADFEIGNKGGRDFWVPHVVFTCGAVPADDKDVIGPDDEILVYYGAADTAIGVASGKLREMVPVLNDIDPSSHSKDTNSPAQIGKVTQAR